MTNPAGTPPSKPQDRAGSNPTLFETDDCGSTDESSGGESQL